MAVLHTSFPDVLYGIFKQTTDGRNIGLDIKGYKIDETNKYIFATLGDDKWIKICVMDITYNYERKYEKEGDVINKIAMRAYVAHKYADSVNFEKVNEYINTYIFGSISGCTKRR